MPDNTGRDQEGKFVPGVSGNPAGRPKGSKNKLQEDFFRDLQSAWEKHGIVALQQMLTEYPEKFVQTVAGLMPKDVNTTGEHTQFIVSDKPISSDEWIKTFVEPAAGSTDRTH